MSESKKKSGEDLVENLKALNIENDINILLLGETGVGKSTFINAIANYCKFRTFKRASDGELSILIPTRFQMYDSRTGESHDIKVGEEIDNNETLAAGASATQHVKSYAFPFLNNSFRLRLIDTPGIVDTRGIHQDRVNMEAILDYVGNLDELHAICLIFKANHTRNTAPFIYAINEIFSRLEKSAAKNLVFAFTNARGQDYSPGGTLECLQDVFAEIEERANKKMKIPLKDNIFCFDNEAFRYLAAVQFGKMEFSNIIKERNIESWNHSYDSFCKMVKYITQCLTPHNVKHTEAVNTARTIIVQMTKPLGEISELINHNILVLETHQDNLSLEYDNLSDLKKRLYMPVIDIKLKELPYPMTVCTSKECCDVKKVGGLNKQHFRAPCHDHCYLTNVENKLIGDAGLKRCYAMNPSTSICNKCTCRYKHHMHIYYSTELIESKQLDENVNKTVLTKEQVIQQKCDLIDKIREKITELKEEHKVIIKSTARFQHFFQTNAITTINDTYKQYIEYLLEKENSMGKDRNEYVISHLNELLQEYQELRKLLIESEKISQQNGEEKSITAKDIDVEKENLFKLKHNGAKLKELFNAQKKAIKAEHQDTIVTTCILGSALESDNEDNEVLEQEDDESDSENSQSSINCENSRRRRKTNPGRGENDRDERGEQFKEIFNKDGPQPYQEHFGHSKHPNDGNMRYQSQTGPGNYLNPGQFNFGGQNQNLSSQNIPNELNQRAFASGGGFPPNKGGFLNQSQYFYNQNTPYNNALFAPQGYGQNNNFYPGPNNYVPNNFGPTAHGSNNYIGPNNYGPNNCPPNNYNSNNYGLNNTSGPSTFGCRNSGNTGDYQNRGNNANYLGKKDIAGVQERLIKNKFDNQIWNETKPNQNQGAEPKQYNQKDGYNKFGNDDKICQGNYLKKSESNKNENHGINRQETVCSASPRTASVCPDKNTNNKGGSQEIEDI